jgi:hypothetical protein
MEAATRAEVERVQPRLFVEAPVKEITIAERPKPKPAETWHGQPDLITWIREKGGINERDPSADIRAWKTKESGYVGLVTKKGQFLDELVHDWIAETGERITTDQLVERISDRIMRGGRQRGPDISQMTEKQLERYFRKAEEEWYREQEAGAIPSFGAIRADVTGLFQRMYDRLDVQAPFKQGRNKGDRGSHKELSLYPHL